jgi:hypothetical protein
MNEIRTVIANVTARGSGGYARRQCRPAGCATRRDRGRPGPHVLHPRAEPLLLTARAASGDAV